MQEQLKMPYSAMFDQASMYDNNTILQNIWDPFIKIV